MTANPKAAEVTMAGGTEGAKPESTGGGAHDNPGRIKLSDLTIHRWNRSHGMTPNERHIGRLAHSINDFKLLHPITLVPVKDKPGEFQILCGANRYWAILQEREQDGYLEPGEYVIRWDLDSEHRDCLEIAVEENVDRLDMSPAEMANYISRLHAEGDVDQDYLGEEFGINRGLVNALCSLPKYFDQLPAGWKLDLQWVHADASDLKYKPVITASHWRHIAAKVKKANGVTDDLRRVMEQASREEWSSEKLRRALNVSEDDGEDTGDTDEVSSASGNDAMKPEACSATVNAGGWAGSPVAAAPAVPAKKGAKAASTATKGGNRGGGSVSNAKPSASSRLDRTDVIGRLVILRGEADQDQEVMAVLDKAIAEIKALAKKPETRAAA